MQRREDSKYIDLFSSPLDPMSKGQEYALEFAVVGSRLVSRFDDRVFKTSVDGTFASGFSYISSDEDFRDIEVINLDGIPEAEALRIIGVDEKGNDTRAAALAAEKQAMEQKQVAQAAASIPELATLDEQLKKLTSERVSAPFEAEVAKLNSGYLGGLDRKRAEEKAAGHLDSVLAIEAEKKLMQGAGAASPQPSASGGQAGPSPCPIPSAEDDANSTTTPAVLKGLRLIYREAYAKIEATRAANLKALTDPLTTRLKLLESDLTKKDRIADAKTVKEYREGLASRSGGLQPPSPSPSGSAPPTPTPAVGNTPLLAAAIKDGFTNSLGMKFVPVKGTDVLFCIHETRRQDYAAYAADEQGVNGEWKNQQKDGVAVSDKDDHPVCGVNWKDARQFCEWLSKKEGKIYRLPTDVEWSYAVGIGRDEKRAKNVTPEMLSGKVVNEFPWGGTFPPKTKDKAGNYGDTTFSETFPKAMPIEDYADGFAATASVMNFKPNKSGLYDMGGNVWEWCEDWVNDGHRERVLRGGSFYGTDVSNLLSSKRHKDGPDDRFGGHGFRVVVETRSPAPASTTKPGTTTTPPPVVPPPAPATAAKSDFSNSLGMKFVKVHGTQVLFCIHETRRQDYAAYAAEVPGVEGDWKSQQKDGIPVGGKDDHPVVSVNWDDANAFSAWLSKKEGRKYRLPTDKEWSCAVGIGRNEKWTKDTTAESLSNKMPNEFPWGGDFPPKTKDQAGNYADMTRHERLPTQTYLEGYVDGYVTTASVMSFKPNKLGLYDLGGNVFEWCEDWYNAAQQERVLRGVSFINADRSTLLSSGRYHLPITNRELNNGFRIVVEMTVP